MEQGLLPPGHPPISKDIPGEVCPVMSTSAGAREAERLAEFEALRERSKRQSKSSIGVGVFTLGTRMSKLAMVQTNLVKQNLEKLWPGTEIRIYGMTTAGDKNQSQPLYLLGGKALWTKELEVALMDGSVDAIVHSLKDVPTEFPPGCELGAVLEREDPSDALCVKKGLPYTSLEQFPHGSVIGTSSVRRVAQLRRRFPWLKFADVTFVQQRGLVQTRLRKLDDPESQYTGLILASAGLIRLGLADRITASVTSPTLYHAVGQGAIGVECRQGDERAHEIVGSIEHWQTGWRTRAERSMLHVLEGGCSVPVGCESEIVELPLTSSPPSNRTNGFHSASASSSDSVLDEGIATTTNGHHAGHAYPHIDDPHTASLTLTGTITSLAGTQAVEFSITRTVHSIQDSEALGADVARELIARGGRDILTELGRHVKEVRGEEGREVPFESNGRAAGNIPPATSKEWRGETEEGFQGIETTLVHPTTGTNGNPKSPHRTVFKEGEVCLRPAGW
ncbi:BZ3500_MvSof-1268-A1-R1_Chr1-1g01109 [Microbotryum saponariae]|uniref:Porphobilinogen deaminase n=1 Tax=Microbotryum saponariae TaxID=289078 RepID=A0A2X0MM75_9BASI|nr:BZ3500_MvSof-1268-A1-R1_Chr1-1g01109 [Microbotryum saponariae]SCZ93394.1 BZ3501_MvSof-1269-A2-R1_Chr1-1g00706 [Microbotryum saponariae]